MNPFGMWYAFATPKEREEFHNAMEQAWKDAQKYAVLPAALMIVLSAALV